MKIQPAEITFLYRTVITLLVLLGITSFVILCFIAKIWLPACVAMAENVGRNIGITW